MNDQIDRAFDELEDKINLYFEKNGSVTSTHELQDKLNRKEKECKELKKTLLEITEKLRNTISMMKTMFNDAS
ncbi:MAG: hypothetical protein HRK26_01105 [Rickettsiaceae bacterium H1]|nr:hypothetical protein [Rickettsiaceae bacterium H1]